MQAVAAHGAPPGQGYPSHGGPPHHQPGSSAHRPAGAGGAWRSQGRLQQAAQPSSSGYRTSSAATARQNPPRTDLQKRNEKVVAEKVRREGEARRLRYSNATATPYLGPMAAGPPSAPAPARQPQQPPPPESLPPASQLQSEIQQQLKERAARLSAAAGRQQPPASQPCVPAQAQTAAAQQQLEQDATRRAGSAGASTSGSESHGVCNDGAADQCLRCRFI